MQKQNKQHMETIDEIWKDIPEYEGKYQASNLGRIRSLHYEGHNEIRVLKQQKRNNYWRISLYIGHSGKVHTVSRLVWVTFNGKIPKGMQVNHIDENTDNNCLWNLNLMSAKTNSNWGTRNNRIAESNKKGKTCKPIIQCDLSGNFIKEWISAQEVKDELNYEKSAICGCCKGYYGRKTYKGYIWRYKN